jgi:hypothetical protein
VNETQLGGDLRGFYAALGVQLPDWARTEAPVSCFTNPDAHAHHDRRPSCSVNLHSGAFNCHGCGAHGGVYDAALAAGYSPKEAIDLMIAHGLTERRHGPNPATAVTAFRPAAAPTEASSRAASPAANKSNGPMAPSVSCSREDVRRWARALSDNPKLLARLRAERGWEPDTLRRCQIGFDGERITVPITDQRGALQGLLRLRVQAWQKPKVLAAAGSRLGLIPHPKLVAGSVVLVEGPSDMLAARSVRLPAVAVPGTHAWHADWARALTGRDVTVVMDADRPGREAAVRIAHDLKRHGARSTIVDLDPTRDDGYDLSDWLQAGNKPAAFPHALGATSNTSANASGRRDGRPLTTSSAPPTATAGHATRPGPGGGPRVSRGPSAQCAAF